MKQHRRLLAVFALFLSGMTLPAALKTPTWAWEETFFKANQAYKEGRFQEAAEGYEALIRSGHGGGHLRYNLGNAYFRLGELGRAILLYERARLKIPRDPDLNFNLRYALDQTQDALVESQGPVEMTFFWLDALTQGELFLGFAVLNGLFWGIGLLRLFRRAEWSYYAWILLLVLWLVCGASLGLKWHRTSTDHRAVVLEKEVDVLAGPAAGDTVLFRLHEGALVRLERFEDGWALIRLADSKRGWVAAGDVQRIKEGGA